MTDKIIDDEEIIKFSNLFGRENNQRLFHDAQGLTFAQALKLLTLPEDSVDDSEHIRKMNAGIRKKTCRNSSKCID